MHARFCRGWSTDSCQIRPSDTCEGALKNSKSFGQKVNFSEKSLTLVSIMCVGGVDGGSSVDLKIRGQSFHPYLNGMQTEILHDTRQLSSVIGMVYNFEISLTSQTHLGILGNT